MPNSDFMAQPCGTTENAQLPTVKTGGLPVGLPAAAGLPGAGCAGRTGASYPGAGLTEIGDAGRSIGGAFDGTTG